MQRADAPLTAGGFSRPKPVPYNVITEPALAGFEKELTDKSSLRMAPGPAPLESWVEIAGAAATRGSETVPRDCSRVRTSSRTVSPGTGLKQNNRVDLRRPRVQNRRLSLINQHAGCAG